MKKAISIFILFLMFYNILGYYIVYSGLILCARQEIRSNIEECSIEGEIVTLIFGITNGKIDDKDIVFENEDEFEYKGCMYDVVSSETKDGYVYFYCINDKNEETVKSALDKHITDNFSTDAASQKRISSLQKNIIKKGINNNSTIQVERINNNCLSFNRMISYLINVPHEIKTPPPKV